MVPGVRQEQRDLLREDPETVVAANTTLRIRRRRGRGGRWGGGGTIPSQADPIPVQFGGQFDVGKAMRPDFPAHHTEGIQITRHIVVLF